MNKLPFSISIVTIIALFLCIQACQPKESKPKESKSIVESKIYKGLEIQLIDINLVEKISPFQLTSPDYDISYMPENQRNYITVKEGYEIAVVRIKVKKVEQGVDDLNIGDIGLVDDQGVVEKSIMKFTDGCEAKYMEESMACNIPFSKSLDAKLIRLEIGEISFDL